MQKGVCGLVMCVLSLPYIYNLFGCGKETVLGREGVYVNRFLMCGGVM